MKTLLLPIAFLTLASVASAEYTDEKGIRRMGSQSKPVVKPITVSVSTQRFAGPLKRIIGGKVYDFTHMITWANDYYFLKLDKNIDKIRSEYDNLMNKEAAARKAYGENFRMTPGSQKEFDEAKAKAQSELGPYLTKWESLQASAEKYAPYILRGAVADSKPDGTILLVGNERVFVKNYKSEGGGNVFVIAVPAGQYIEALSNGSTATLRAYDYGVPAN